MDSRDTYYTPPQQGSGSRSNYQDDIDWETSSAVPRLYQVSCSGGTDMKWTSSTDSSQSALSGYSDPASSAIPSPSTDYAPMSSYEASPHTFGYGENYTTTAEVVGNASYSSYSKSNAIMQHRAEVVSPTRHTAATLGWHINTDLLKFYSFVIIKGKEPYFELLPGWKPTREMPQTVHLESSSNSRSGHSCHYPNGCRKRFNRPADLERHYKNVHADMQHKDCYSCDYGKCGRSTDPFTRKDHYRDHLRDYHKEDLGRAKIAKDKTKISSNEAARLQEQWLEERVIFTNWWRCVRCLARMYVETNGWACSACKIPCESDRKARRQISPYTTASSDNYPCLQCSGTGVIENSSSNGYPEPCYMCDHQTTTQAQIEDTSTYYATESDSWATTDYDAGY